MSESVANRTERRAQASHANRERRRKVRIGTIVLAVFTETVHRRLSRNEARRRATAAVFRLFGRDYLPIRLPQAPHDLPVSP